MFMYDSFSVDQNCWHYMPQPAALTLFDVALLCAGTVDAKHSALFGTQMVATVILRLDHDAFVDLHSIPRNTALRWRTEKLSRTNISQVLVPLDSGTKLHPCHAEHHLDRCLVHPQEQQPDKFLDLQPQNFQECAHLQLALAVASRAAQHVANDGNLVLDHRVFALTRQAVEFSPQYSRILQVLHDLLLSSANERSEVVHIHCDIDVAVDFDGDECDQHRV